MFLQELAGPSHIGASHGRQRRRAARMPKMAPPTRLELATNGLTVRRSTTLS